MMRHCTRLKKSIQQAIETTGGKVDPRWREGKQAPPLLRTLIRQKDEKKQLELHNFIQSSVFQESYSYQIQRVSSSHPRVPCYIGVSRNDILIRYTDPVVLENKKKNEKLVSTLPSTYFAVVGSSGYALNLATLQSNIGNTGFSHISFPVICVVHDQRELNETSIINFKMALKKSGFAYSLPFSGQSMKYIATLDDQAPYKATILLRRLRISGDPGRMLQKRLDVLTQEGFINYFGCRSTMSSDQGKNLLSGKWVKFMIGELSSWDIAGTIRAYPDISDFSRRPSLHSAQNLLKALGESFHGSNGYRFIKEFIETQGNIRKSILSFSPACCHRHILHTQRVIWNALASVRLQQYGATVQVGDMVVERETPRDLYIHNRTTFPRFMVKTITSTEEIHRYSIFEVVLPLPFSDGEIHKFHFPNLRGVALQDYLDFSEKIGAKYFWDPPPVIRAILHSFCFELQYRCIMAKPIQINHQTYIDPKEYDQNTQTNDNERLLENEYTRLEPKIPDVQVDEPDSDISIDENLLFRYADRPFQATRKKIDVPSWGISIENNQVKRNSGLEGSFFDDISLELSLKLPMDVDFYSCLREVFTFEPQYSDTHKKWARKIRLAYRDLKKITSIERPNIFQSILLEDKQSNNFESTWICALCGAVNDQSGVTCEICSMCRGNELKSW